MAEIGLKFRYLLSSNFPVLTLLLFVIIGQSFYIFKIFTILKFIFQLIKKSLKCVSKSCKHIYTSYIIIWFSPVMYDDCLSNYLGRQKMLKWYIQTTINPSELEVSLFPKTCVNSTNKGIVFIWTKTAAKLPFIASHPGSSDSFG